MLRQVAAQNSFVPGQGRAFRFFAVTSRWAWPAVNARSTTAKQHLIRPVRPRRAVRCWTVPARRREIIDDISAGPASRTAGRQLDAQRHRARQVTTNCSFRSDEGGGCETAAPTGAIARHDEMIVPSIAPGIQKPHRHAHLIAAGDAVNLVPAQTEGVADVRRAGEGEVEIPFAETRRYYRSRPASARGSPSLPWTLDRWSRHRRRGSKTRACRSPDSRSAPDSKVGLGQKLPKDSRSQRSGNEKQSDPNEEVVDGHTLVACLVSGSDFEAECFDLCSLRLLWQRKQTDNIRKGRRNRQLWSYFPKLNPRQLAHRNVPRQVNERLRRRDTRFPSAPVRNDLVVLSPDGLAVLADMGEQRPLFLFQHRRDIHVSVR